MRATLSRRRDVARRGARARLAASIALAAAMAVAGCGDGSSPPQSVPIGTVCVPLSFGSVSFDLMCMQDTGGLDRVCDFVFTSSNPGVVAISPSTISVGENQSTRATLTTIGNSEGTSSLDGDSDNGPPFHIGFIRVGC